MRLVVTAFCGFLIGTTLALAGIYYNPFIARSGEVAGLNARVFQYSSPFTEGLAVTHDGDSRLPLRPAAIPELWESTISDSMLSLVVLRDEQDAPVGIASRVSQLSEDTELLTGGVLVDDEWLITIPDEGSLYLSADSNLWPFVRDAVIPVWYLDRPWQGPKSYRPTAGPHDSGSAVVKGATGSFAGVEGTAVESYEIAAFDQMIGPGDIDARLFLTLPGDSTNLASE